MSLAASLRDFAPEVGLILGSGLEQLVEIIRERQELPFAAFPGLPVPRVPGHAGKFVVGTLSGVRVAAACGRAHLYEGWSARDVAAGVRLLHAAGIRSLLVFNSAGSTNPSFPPGSWMLIADQINLTGQSPLLGETRFTDMTGAYSERWRGIFKEAAHAERLPLQEGVYASVLGPQFETAAEIRMLQAAGADAVGMSTVHEVIQARALGIEVAGFSAISNWACGLAPAPLSHQEVLDNGSTAARTFQAVLHRALGTPGAVPPIAHWRAH